MTDLASNNAGPSPRVLVDTSVLRVDPDVLTRIHGAGGAPFLPSTVLDELDFQKQRGEEGVKVHARRLVREFAKTGARRDPDTPLPGCNSASRARDCAPSCRTGHHGRNARPCARPRLALARPAFQARHGPRPAVPATT